MDRPPKAQHLTVEQVDLRLDPDRLGFGSTEELEPLGEIVGQERAQRALDLGLGIRHESYNIFVAGLNGTGKKETIRRELARRGVEESVPSDWIYVNNFETPDRPLAISLPAGQGGKLKQDIENLLQQLMEELPKAFREEDFSREKRRISDQYQKRRRGVFEELEKLAREKGLVVEQMPNGQVALQPLKDDRPMTNEEVNQLSEEERKDLQERQREVAQYGEEILRRQEDISRELRNEVRNVERSFAAKRIDPQIKSIAERYQSEKLRRWMEQLGEHMVDHLDRFREAEDGQQQQMAMMMGMPQPSQEERVQEYRVNLLVDNGRQEGAPVVIEESPNYKNLFGTIEKVVDRSGKLVTDFSRIKAGSLLRANGGYLVVNLIDALIEPLVWKELKRTLKSGQLKIETYDPFALFSTSAMNPEPVPLDVKLVVLGNPLLYHLLHLHDEDFPNIFKVKAEFVSEMDREEESGRVVGRLASKLTQQESLPPVTGEGVAELVRAGCRLANDKQKLTAEFSRIADLTREAGYWSRRDNASTIDASHVRQALDEKVYRSDWIAAKIRELIRQGTLRIQLEGKAVGQVNGLAVANLGDYAFGRPSRVTASLGVGAAGVINIERESKLSGSSYDKGVLILDGYLRNQYAAEHPLALSASIAMEQSYGMIDGDSASATELLCLLSVLGKVPMRQDIAVSGSVNQWGEVQAIGAVNEKVEGFFDVCREQGLTGEQGVCVPAANVRNLLLRGDVVSAIEKGDFHVWAIQDIDEGLELLGGIPPGRLDEEEAFHGRVDRRLRKLADAIKEQRATPLEREFPVWEPAVEGPSDPRPSLPGRE
ncbi:MAG: Lon protease family protein [Planctomycetota bacterium]